MMSEIACVYNDGLWCKKFSTEEKTSHCCMRFDDPCPHQTPSNADRIRAMSDEELAELLADETHRIAKPVFDYFGYGIEKQIVYARRLEWLQQPAGGADHE